MDFHTAKKMIIEALKHEALAPNWGFSFGLWFSHTIPQNVVLFLVQEERKQGDEYITHWMIETLLESGLYVMMGDDLVVVQRLLDSTRLYTGVYSDDHLAVLERTLERMRAAGHFTPEQIQD